MRVGATIKNRLKGAVPAEAIRKHSKAIFLPGFGGISLYEVWRPFFKQLGGTRLPERASGISFNIVMAIPPTLIFVFTLVPYLPISDAFMEQLYNLIRDVVPGEKNNAVIIGFLKDFIDRPRNELLSFGLLFAILFSSNAMMGVLRSFDRDQPGFVRRKGLYKRGLALQLTLVVLLLVGVCITLIIAQYQVLGWIGVESELWRSVIHHARWVPLIALTFYVVALIYRHGAPTVHRWPLFTPGAVFATSLMALATVLVTWYVNHFSNYNKVYGSIGAIFILMSLIYANSIAVLIGFELNVTITQLKQQKAAASLVAEGNNSL